MESCWTGSNYRDVLSSIYVPDIGRIPSSVIPNIPLRGQITSKYAHTLVNTLNVTVNFFALPGRSNNKAIVKQLLNDSLSFNEESLKLNYTPPSNDSPPSSKFSDGSV